MSHLSAFFDCAAALLGALAAPVLPSDEHEGHLQYPGGVTALEILQGFHGLARFPGAYFKTLQVLKFHDFSPCIFL